MNSEKKLLIFDFDGTLCDTQNAICKVLTQTFQQRAIPIQSTHNLMSLIGQGIGLTETIQACAPDLSDTDVQDMVILYRKIYNGGEGLKHTTLFPNAENVLLTLKKDGHALVLISNKGKVAITNAIQHFSLEPYFTIVLGEQKDIPKKPSPDIFYQKIEPHFSDIAIDNVFVIGDTVADIGFSKNIKAKAIWASYGYGDKNSCLQHKPEYEISSLANIPNLVLQHRN